MFSGKKKGRTSEIPRPAARRPVPDSTAAAEGQQAKLARDPKPSRGSDVGGRESSKLNSHLTFQGDIRFSGSLLIDCEVRGSIVTEDTLIVGASGRVDAEVTAGTIEISGKVRGNIKAKTSVKILSGGEVHGNIETPSISMEPGVVFEGNCTRPSSTQRSEPAARPYSSREATPSSEDSVESRVTTISST